MSTEFDKMKERFIENVIRSGFNVSGEEIAEVLKDMKSKINSSKEPDEIVGDLLIEVNEQVKELTKNYPIPGYNIEISSGHINANTYGGVLDAVSRPMTKNAIFDTASITKLFTQIISYNLIKEGYYKFDNKASDLDNRFKNSGDLTIGQIMGFVFSYSFPDGRKFEKANSVEEAKDILYTLGVDKKDTYTYIDFGMMTLKEIMERVTGMSYEQLVKKYITDKLGLKNTFLTVPENKRDLLTGTPNAHLGVNNDLKAVKAGGFSGNAGVQSTSADLLTVAKNLYVNDNFFPSEYLFHVYTESDYSKNAKDSKGNPDPWQRGIMGNSCTIGGSFVDKISPTDSSAYQGSTRTQLNVGTFGNVLTTSAILLNPASMGLERAYEIEERINRGADPTKQKKLVTEYIFEGKNYTQISPQIILSTGGVVKPLTNTIAKLSLRLAFLNTYMQENNLNKEVNVEMENGNIKK